MTKAAAILGFVNSVLFIALAFGVEITDVQQAAITGFVNGAMILGAALLDPKVPFGAYPAVEAGSRVLPEGKRDLP